MYINKLRIGNKVDYTKPIKFTKPSIELENDGTKVSKQKRVSNKSVASKEELLLLAIKDHTPLNATISQGKTSTTPYDKQKQKESEKKLELLIESDKKAKDTEKAMKDLNGVLSMLNPSTYYNAYQLAKETPGETINPNSIGGMAFDVIADPTTWMSLGTLPLLKIAGKEVAPDLLSKGMQKAVASGRYTPSVGNWVKPSENFNATYFTKAWKDGKGSNPVALITHKDHPGLAFELVQKTDANQLIIPNAFDIHFKTDQDFWKQNPGMKKTYFTEINNMLPEGARISTSGVPTPGGVHGLNRFGKNFNYQLSGINNDGNLIFLKPYKNDLSYYTLGNVNFGQEMAAKFFETDVVKDSYEHNKALAKKLGVTLQERPKDISNMIRTPIKTEFANFFDGRTTASYLRGDLYGDPYEKLILYKYPSSNRVHNNSMIHEFLHRGHYASPLKFKHGDEQYFKTVFAPEYNFYNWKANKILNNEGKKNNYLTNIYGGELGVNLIDAGRNMGIKLGQKYPGKEAFENLLNNYNGHKKFILKYLDFSRPSNYRKIWDALTGRYFIAPAAISTSLLTTNQSEKKKNGGIINYLTLFKDGGEIDNLGMNGMMKAKLALASHFGNKTARRMTNYDTRSAMTPEGLGNVYMGSYGNYATPSILEVNGELKYIPKLNLFNSKENSKRSKDQSIKFDREKDARYFAEHYKEIAPMMKLWDDK